MARASTAAAQARRGMSATLYPRPGHRSRNGAQGSNARPLLPMGREQMRWLKNTVVALLLIAAAVVTLGTLFSDHSAQYGEVGLPSGGLVHLPSGTVTVFLSTPGQT